MLLTITTTRAPATDLGYLLHKHPDRVQSFTESAGTAYVFYPEANEQRCTAALLLEVDPIGLVRGRAGDAFALGQYVNDRPYAASSLLAIALKDVYRTAMTGTCTALPEVAANPLPLEINVAALPCRGGAALAHELFAPLGWTVEAAAVPLDPDLPAWGDSRYVNLRLRGELRLADALNHLYVLLPVLDDAKHYWVGQAEVDKLVRAGGSWLATHPARETIAQRYLKHRRELAGAALARLTDLDDATDGTDGDAAPEAVDAGDRLRPLAEHRRAAVLAALHASGARRVADLGCGEGTLVRELLAVPGITSIVATDVSMHALRVAARRLGLDQMSEPQRARIEIFQSALTYRDDRLTGLDAAVLMEVIEHVDLPRLPSLERTVFGCAAPRTVLVTTPNAEHNVRYASLPADTMRHHDHRFEWTRSEFADWAGQVCDHYGYDVHLLPVGGDDAEVGPPTQLAIFTRRRDKAAG